jgi:Rieske Fe-S protein
VAEREPVERADQRLTRRALLAAGAGAAVAAGCGDGGGDGDGDGANDRRAPQPPRGFTRIGPVADLYPDRWTSAFAGEEEIYVRGGTSVVALSARCTHRGCPVRYVEASEFFVCPCHGGVFDAEGEVEGGPPRRPLIRLPTRIVGGDLYVRVRLAS